MYCYLVYVEDIKERSNTPKGCDATYVEDVEDRKRTYTHNFPNIQPILNPQKVLESRDIELFNHAIKYCVY